MLRGLIVSYHALSIRESACCRTFVRMLYNLKGIIMGRFVLFSRMKPRFAAMNKESWCKRLVVCNFRRLLFS